MLIVQDIKATNWLSTLHSALVHNPNPMASSFLLLCSKFCSFFLTVPLARKCQCLLPWVREVNNIPGQSCSEVQRSLHLLLPQAFSTKRSKCPCDAHYHSLLQPPTQDHCVSWPPRTRGTARLSSLNRSSSCTSLSFSRDSPNSMWWRVITKPESGRYQAEYAAPIYSILWNIVLYLR